jgi:hypothetical protein
MSIKVQKIIYPVLIIISGGIFHDAFCDSANTDISGDISGLKFSTAQKMYRVVKDIEVPQGKHARLPAGIILLFNRNTSFQINGSCTIEGSEDAPVFLTSYRDPEFDSASTSAAPYDWKGITVSDSAAELILQHTSVKYATVPLVSNSPAIRLNCVKLYTTGISKLIISGDTLPVVNDNCYDFPPKAPEEKVDSTPALRQDTVSPKPVVAVTDSVKPKRSWWKQPRFRWTIGGAGTAAFLAGGGCFIGYYVKHSQSSDAYQIYLDTDIRDLDYRTEQKEVAVNAKKASQHFKNAGIFSGMVSILFLAGFGLTFYF